MLIDYLKTYDQKSLYFQFVGDNVVFNKILVAYVQCSSMCCIFNLRLRIVCTRRLAGSTLVEG